MENTTELQLKTVADLAQLDHIALANTIINSVLEGEVDPLQTHMFLKRIEKISEIVKENKQVKEAVTNAASQYGDKPFDFMGATLKVGAVHTAYDFSSCGDITWNNLNELFNTIKELKADREKVLKAAFPDNPKFGFTAPRVVVDKVLALTEMDCGEEVVLAAPRKIQQTGVKVTFKKMK